MITFGASSVDLFCGWLEASELSFNVLETRVNDGRMRVLAERVNILDKLLFSVSFKKYLKQTINK